MPCRKTKERERERGKERRGYIGRSLQSWRKQMMKVQHNKRLPKKKKSKKSKSKNKDIQCQSRQ